MTYYLSGPMTGLPRHGFPAFAAAAADLRSRGHAVVSPAELSVARVAAGNGGVAPPYLGNEAWYEQQFALVPREVFLRQDAVAVSQSDGVVVLDGWEESDGARFEVALARKLNIPVLEYPDLRELTPLTTVIKATGANESRRADASGAVKDDGGKVPLHLLPVRPLWGIAEVLGFGATKYAPHNWRRGFAWSRMYSAMQRHLTLWWEGEDLDGETGMSHLWHAGCDLLFLAEFESRGTGTDDRWKE